MENLIAFRRAPLAALEMLWNQSLHDAPQELLWALMELFEPDDSGLAGSDQ